MEYKGIRLFTIKALLGFWAVLMIAILLPESSFSQCPGYLLLYSQDDVDSFAIEYPNCTEIEGQVYIDGDDITNLQGLSSLVSVIGEFHIIDNPNLQTLVGLENLTSVGGWMQISDNTSLRNLDGLNNLSFIGSELDIMYNPELESIEGLSNLETVDGGISIIGNLSLPNLQGLDSFSVMSGLNISENDSLISLAGLDNLQLVYDHLYIANNAALINLVGLDSLNTVWGSLSISGGGFTSLSGLQKLEFINGGLGLSYLYNVQNLDGLASLEAINNTLFIKQCNSLVTLNGLESLRAIGGGLNIIENNSLQSLSGIDSINAKSIQSLSINYNPQLSICEVQSVCDYLAAPNGAIQIYVNAPGCNNSVEIEDACESIGISELELDFELSTYPNPFSTSTTIKYELTEPTHIQLTIYNHLGEAVEEAVSAYKPPGVHTYMWSTERLSEGMYLAVLRSGDGVSVVKLIKQ